MGYKKEPVGHMKASTGNKAVGFMTEGSSAYMSALHQTDPKDGVVVTGDASKIGGQTTMTEREKNKADYDKKIEAKRIELANKKMQQELERETRRAEAGARLEQRRQKRREQEGKDYIDPKTGNVVRRSGPLNQNDPKDGGTTKMKDLALSSKARYDEYNKRGWMHDETSLTQTDRGKRQTDLRKSSNFSNVLDRNRVPIDTKEYNRRKALNNPDISMTDLFTTHSNMVPQSKRVKLPKGTGYSNINQRINDFR
jgi:hypothetical protein